MKKFIPVIFQAASLLAALTHPGHIVLYAPEDSLPCRRDATRNLLGIYHSFKLNTLEAGKSGLFIKISVTKTKIFVTKLAVKKQLIPD